MKYLNFLRHVLKFSLKCNELKKLHNADIILIGNDHDRSFSFLGKKYSQILDSLDFFFSQNGLTTAQIAFPVAVCYEESTFGNALSVNGVYIRAKILNKIFNLLLIRRINPIVNFWIKLIGVVKPRYIIGIQPSPELCLAAQKLGIMVFDYQHGVLSGEGYYGNQYRSKFNNYGWPDAILIWNQGSLDWVINNCSNISLPILLGNPWFLRFSETNSEDSLVSYYLSKTPISANSINILISLQWGYSSKDTFLGIPKGLFSYIIGYGNNFFWRIRIHPIMLNNPTIMSEFRDVFHGYDNVEWINSSINPLPLVLKNVDLHFTSHSAVTIEASWYGVKTALMFSNVELLSEYFGEQIKSGFAEIINDDINEIDKWISSNFKIDKIQNNNYISSTILLNKFISNLKSNSYYILLFHLIIYKY
jgi:hypothetical protein